MGSFFVYQHYSVTTILQVVTPISILKNVILGSSLQYRFSKIIPSFFVDKASCTRQFESEFSLHSLASLFPIKEGSTFLTKPLFPQRREDVTALRCSEPLRSKVGGASMPSPCCAGWDRLIITSDIHNQDFLYPSFQL